MRQRSGGWKANKLLHHQVCKGSQRGNDAVPGKPGLIRQWIIDSTSNALPRPAGNWTFTQKGVIRRTYRLPTICVSRRLDSPRTLQSQIFEGGGTRGQVLERTCRSTDRGPVIGRTERPKPTATTVISRSLEGRRAHPNHPQKINLHRHLRILKSGTQAFEMS